MADTVDTSDDELHDGVRALADRIALVKASVLGERGAGGGGAPASNALPWTDVERHQQVFQGLGVLEPPYDPETLAILFENSSSLRPNVDAYATNIDAFGHRFEAVIDLESNDVDERIGNAMFIERARRKGNPRILDDAAVQALPDMPTPEEIAARKAEVAAQLRLERYRLEMFFEACSLDISFVSLRRWTRQDIEVIGNGYWEVLRDGGGAVVQFTYLPGFTMRLMPLGLELVEVELKVKISELEYDTVPVRRRFRRYVQLFEQQVVYFKEFGDPRIMSRKYGFIAPSVEALFAADPEDGPATEVLHFKVHNSRSAYGTPRWIGALLSVLGSRQAEEVNYLYFENKSVPPLALLVSGGRLSAQSVPRIETFIETHLKGKKNFHRVLVIEAESPNGVGVDSGRMKIELRPLTSAQNNDATHLAYDERNTDKVGGTFRLPRLLRGDIRDFNRSCYAADTETLTEEGWKLHHQIEPGERIAVYDARKDELRFEVPSGKHVAGVSEELLHFADAHTDVLVTHDHKMLVRVGPHRWHAPASDVAALDRFELLCAPAADRSGDALRQFVLPSRDDGLERAVAQDGVPGDLWLELLGYFAGLGGLGGGPDGGSEAVWLRATTLRARAAVSSCIARLGWACTTRLTATAKVFGLSHPGLYDWLAGHCGAVDTERCLPWPFITGLPRRQLQILFDAIHADGSPSVPHRHVGCSERLAGQVQVLSLRLGLRATLQRTRAAAFVVESSVHRSTNMEAAQHVRRMPYQGDVYCYSCPGAGFFVTRRNGKIAIQGNTADAAMTLAEMQVFQPEREEFDFAINHRVLSALGIRFWRFRSNAPVTRDPTAMAEIVRNLVNAGVLTPEEGRALAADVFNREFKHIAAAWVKQPLALTLAGVATSPASPDDNPTPEVQKRATTPRSLADEAARLIALRDALREAARDAAARELREAPFAATPEPAGELEREVIKVPADELASWFEKEVPNS